MMYEMRRRKRDPTLLQTQVIFNLPHHIGMAREELAFDGATSYTIGHPAWSAFSAVLRSEGGTLMELHWFGETGAVWLSAVQD